MLCFSLFLLFFFCTKFLSFFLVAEIPVCALLEAVIDLARQVHEKHMSQKVIHGDITPQNILIVHHDNHVHSHTPHCAMLIDALDIPIGQIAYAGMDEKKRPEEERREKQGTIVSFVTTKALAVFREIFVFYFSPEAKVLCLCDNHG